jgi:hypothetical protein
MQIQEVRVEKGFAQNQGTRANKTLRAPIHLLRSLLSIVSQMRGDER